jgi:hypothetical protein
MRFEDEADVHVVGGVGHSHNIIHDGGAVHSCTANIKIGSKSDPPTDPTKFCRR